MCFRKAVNQFFSFHFTRRCIHTYAPTIKYTHHTQKKSDRSHAPLLRQPLTRFPLAKSVSWLAVLLLCFPPPLPPPADMATERGAEPNAVHHQERRSLLCYTHAQLPFDCTRARTYKSAANFCHFAFTERRAAWEMSSYREPAYEGYDSSRLRSRTRVQAAQQELVCPICIETYSEPRTLTCQHTFCTACLLQLAAASGRGEKGDAAERSQQLRGERSGVRNNHSLSGMSCQHRSSGQRRCR